MPALFFRLSPLFLAGALLSSPAPFSAPARAQTAKSNATAKSEPIEVAICELQNGGNLEERSGEAPLEIQYSQGLAHYLGEQLKAPQFRVTQRKKPRGLEQGAFFLSGELCKVGGTNGAGASYFCTLRLHQILREKRPRLVNSWSGFAQNYRWLSTNLSNDPQINREGLLGALGEKVVAQIKASEGESSGQAARDFEARLQRLSPASHLQITPLGARRVRVASGQNATLSVVRCESGKTPALLSETGAALTANAPLDLDLTALEAPNRAPVTLYFLVQNASRGAQSDGAQTRGLDFKSPGEKAPVISPLLNEEKMNELRRQIAPPQDDFLAGAPVLAPRRTDSSEGFGGPSPVQVLEGAPVLPPAPLLPGLIAKLNEGNWQMAQWNWR